MANEFYTLIVVPHAKARFRKVQVSVKLMKWVGSAATLLSVALVAVLVHYTRSRTRSTSCVTCGARTPS